MDVPPLGLAARRWPRSAPAPAAGLHANLRGGQGQPRRLVLEGHLGARTAPQLHAALRAALLAPGETLVLDLGALARLDPSGLAALAEASEQARRHGARLALAHLPALARLWVVRASLHQVLDLEPS